MNEVRRTPMPRSPTPRSALSGVTTPRTMFWSTWSIITTRPSTHMGHVESPAGSGLSLDRHPHEGAVLRPGAVVVLDVGAAEQLVEHEPGMGRALTDAAVGDHLRVVRDAGALVKGGELVGRLEGAVLVGGLAPRHVGRPRHVAGHLGLLLGQVGGRHQLAPVLLGRAHVDELRLAELGQDLVAEGAQLVAHLARDLEVGRLRRRRVGDKLATLELPLLAAAVEELDAVEAEIG